MNFLLINFTHGSIPSFFMVYELKHFVVNLFPSHTLDLS